MTDRTGLVFVLLPRDTFKMGAQSKDPSSPNYDPEFQPSARDGPPIDVPVQAFFMAKHEMTQAQWERSTGANPSMFQKNTVKPDESLPTTFWLAKEKFGFVCFRTSPSPPSRRRPAWVRARESLSTGQPW